METVIKNPNWWRRRSRLERLLTVASVVGLIAVIALGISLFHVLKLNKYPKGDEIQNITAQALKGQMNDEDTFSKNLPKQNICLTSDCIHSASTILKSMNPSVKPCADFYNFACGNYLENTIIPDDKVEVTRFSLVGEHLQEQLRVLVNEEPTADEAKPFRLAKDLYQACMNTKLIEERGLEPLKKIHEEFGGWPVIVGDKWNADSFDWIDMTKKFNSRGFSFSYIVNMQIGTDFKNTTSRKLYLDQAFIGLFREYLIKGIEDNAVKAYYNYMVDMAVIFGAEQKAAESELMDSLNFEIALANISLPREKRRNATALYNPMTISDIQSNYSYIDWMDIWNHILPDGINVDENEVIIVRVPSFLEDLEELLNQTSKRTIANYLMWRMTGISSFFLSPNVRKRQLQFTKDVIGKEQEEPRWKECVDIVSGSHGLPISLGVEISLSAAYIRKYFDQESKTEAIKMVNNIRDEFENTLNNIEWMDDNTRQQAKHKLKAMEEHIGFPNELNDDKKLEEYYKNLEIDSELYFETVMNMSIFGTNYEFSKLRLPVNKSDWETHSKVAVVAAYYAFAENSLKFPAGILQGHFFSAHRPNYLNYGAIGLVIGHEITHGFDDQGRQYDESGNLAEWWAEDTREAYLKKAKCIIEEYGNFTEPITGLELNGITTQGENIADNGGVKQAYFAYQNWAKTNKEIESKLPGLDYTPEQMFWIASAQNWCAVYRKEALQLRIKTGAHSPTQFRVFGPLSNSQEFSKDFNCESGTPMNPIDKCEVW